jgi:amino acid transporter
MAEPAEPHLDRGLNLMHATSLNVANMLGAGPFFTIPAFVATMGGPQCIVGWLIAMLIVMCDGLIWAELGAALPGSGGTYHYYREIFRGSSWGRLLPFLFIWQFLASGTLEVASGYIAASQFTFSLWPSALENLYKSTGVHERIAVGALATLLVVLIFVACCQQIRSLGRLIMFLIVGILASVGTIIVLGIINFDASLIQFPPNAFHLDRKFFDGLGAASTIAVFDYLGYYNICHMGEEVRTPAKTIPRAVLLSIAIVATIYVLMNLSFMGTVPWQEIIEDGSLANKNISKAFMTKLCGENAATGFTLLIIWTCLAGLFAMMLGYSRIIYAAAKNGDFFSAFATLHPTRHFPWAALALLSIITAFLCFFSLDFVLKAAVIVRILLQFIGQIFALHVLRRSRKFPLPFRMWLYPLPCLVALVGWVFLLSTNERKLWGLVLIVYASGFIAYFLRERFVASPRNM